MTDEEAVDILDDNFTVVDTHGHYSDEEVEEARQLAIKALQSKRNIINEAICQQLIHMEAENERLHDALERLKQEPCEDCVSKQELLKLLDSHDCKKWYDCFEHQDECMFTPHTNIKNDIRYNIINKLSPVRPIIKTAKWEKHDTGHSIYYDCSSCHCVATYIEALDGPIWKLSSYCPDCGAKMED